MLNKCQENVAKKKIKKIIYKNINHLIRGLRSVRLTAVRCTLRAEIMHCSGGRVARRFLLLQRSGALRPQRISPVFLARGGGEVSRRLPLPRGFLESGDF